MILLHSKCHSHSRTCFSAGNVNHGDLSVVSAWSKRWWWKQDHCSWTWCIGALQLRLMHKLLFAKVDNKMFCSYMYAWPLRENPTWETIVAKANTCSATTQGHVHEILHKFKDLAQSCIALFWTHRIFISFSSWWRSCETKSRLSQFCLQYKTVYGIFPSVHFYLFIFFFFCKSLTLKQCQHNISIIIWLKV